ncbi:DUF11 domain-containing protein [Microbacterium maritypicum]|uniref:DUF11 domain-containing protein n=1 Tax=Microbacterium maritypicum TaxID=33918 RepID=A0AAD3ZZC0_MICMQ|nr:DUF11 domain-containing protein [Microbacterium liquefaciens]
MSRTAMGGTRHASLSPNSIGFKLSAMLIVLVTVAMSLLGAMPSAQAAVPAPPPGSAVISVKVGGDRAANGTVQGVAGVQLSLFGAGTASTEPTAVSFSQGAVGAQYDSSWSWTTCVSDADGDCNFIIPIRAGAASATGVPQDTRFWVAQTGASPAGWYSNPDARVGGFGATPDFDVDYRFRTDTQLRAGVTYLSTTAMTDAAAFTNPDLGFMRNRLDANTEGGQGSNVTRTTGLWNQSRVNPAFPAAQCGLNIAIVADTSGSLGATGIAALKDTMGGFVDAFRGTPTTMSLFSFSTVSPGNNASNNPTPLSVTTTAEADAFKAQYAAWNFGGGTSWDRGLAAAANSGNAYDLVVMLTDGNPTVYSDAPGASSSAFNAFQDIDAGIFSANQLKAQGSRVIAVGVGPALTPASAYNLRAVSGTVANSDYVLAADFDDASEYLASLAADCDSSLQVQKMIVPEGGTIAQATPGENWEMTASTTATGTSLVGATTALTLADGTVNYGVAYTAPTTSGVVQVLETQQPGYELFPVAGSNAVCINQETGAPVAVTNAGTTSNPGFGVNTQQGVQVSCIIYNTPAAVPAEPGFTLTKTSDPVSGSAVAGGDTITYTVTGTNTGSTVLDPVTITDDLSDVLNNATLTGTPTASVGAAPVLTGDDLAWTGSLPVGGSVTLTYTVTLDANVPAGTVINNVASGSATPPGLPPIVPPPVETEHPVPGFTLTKTSDPETGSAVAGGDTITYTVTGTNTGATVLDPVAITDDLSQVLNNATLTGTPSASLGAAPALTGTTLTWNGSLTVGQSVELTYTVTLDADVPAGTVVNNRVEGSATPPGLPPIVPPPVETEHPVPGFTLTKTSDPVSGTTVDGGDTITYTVTGTNTGATVLDPVTITDDLSDVLNNAALTGTPTASVGSAPVLAGDEMTWTGVLPVGGVVVLTYTVTLDADVPTGTFVNNRAEGSATPPGLPPIVPPPVETEHPTPGTPGFELTKTSDPVSGSAVAGGSTITYTVTGTNTGATVLDPVTITDDLSQVLNHAELTGTPTASLGAAPVLAGTTLTWNGSLAVGESVVLTYTVTIDADVPAGTIVNNVAEGSATPPGLPPITPPPVQTEHPVPGFALTKTSDPVSGSAVIGGDTITYTVTGTNTGATVLDPVTITDDLSQVLNNAELTGTPTASLGAAPVLTGTTLTWNGSLAVGESVELTYTVTLDADVPAGTVINNVAEGSATPPGLPPIVPPPVETEHPVPGFALTKTSDPVSGSAVAGGSTITYTVTGTNTGATILDPVTITDDLSDVLNNATLTGTPTASVGAVPVLTGDELAWTGSLPVGGSVVLTYTVTLDADVPAGTIINNVAEGSATPPGLPPIVPPPVETEHPVPGFTLTKTSDPIPGTLVRGGDTITYTVTGTNTGATVLDPVTITDDLSQVLNNATLTGTPTASLGAAPALTGTTLTWNGSLAVGEAVVLTYTVTLNADVPPATVVKNHVEGSATPPGLPPIVPPPVETEHPTPGAPGFSLTKTSDPASGSTVVGGDTITYTVTGTNTGATVLDPVTITDDLSQVLNNATLTGTPTASLGTAPALTGTTLTWNGSLAVGESVVLTYTVTLDADVPAGTIVNNVAQGSATPPGLPPITPPPVETEHPVPGFTVTKTSDPASGTRVKGGDTITYTVTGTNTGATVLDPVVLTDDMSKVLNHAELTGTPSATVNGAAATAPTLSGTTLSWTGALPVGAQVVVVYSVKVDASVPGGTVVNNHLEGSAQPPSTPENPVPPITPPPVETNHDTPPAPGLAITGGEIATGVVLVGLLMLGAGGLLVMARRRRDDAQV